MAAYNKVEKKKVKPMEKWVAPKKHNGVRGEIE